MQFPLHQKKTMEPQRIVQKGLEEILETNAKLVKTSHRNKNMQITKMGLRRG